MTSLALPSEFSIAAAAMPPRFRPVCCRNVRRCIEESFANGRARLPPSRLPGDEGSAGASPSRTNGYSVLLIGTSNGILYCVQIKRKKDQGFIVNNLCTFEFDEKEIITHINVDILLKGFIFSKEKLVDCRINVAFQSGTIKSIDFKCIKDKL